MGGLAGKRCSVFLVTIASEIFGMVFILPIALWLKEPWLPLPEFLWASLAGIVGAGAIFTLYLALSTEKMSLVAPLAGVVAAGVAAVIGITLDGWPKPLQLAGFGLALAGIWLLSAPQAGGLELKALPLPLGAGVLGGLFFVAIHQASHTSVFWPNFVERAVGLGLVFAVMAFARQPLTLRAAPWRLLTLLGILDTAGACLFTLGAQVGRLDVATVLSSLYPGGTILLAWGLLKERITPLQWAGIAISLVAIALIAM